MVVQPEEAAAPADVEPGIVVDEQLRSRGLVVAIEFADHSQHLAEAEVLELLQRGRRLAEQVETALEGSGVPLGDGPRIGLRAALGFARQKVLAQLLVQRFRIRQAGERKGRGKEWDDVGHAPRLTFSGAKKNGGP